MQTLYMFKAGQNVRDGDRLWSCFGFVMVYFEFYGEHHENGRRGQTAGRHSQNPTASGARGALDSSRLHGLRHYRKKLNEALEQDAGSHAAGPSNPA